MPKRPARLTLALLLLATPTLAAPARVRVPGALVRARPEAGAPVVHTLAERAEVSVSEEVLPGGWREVQLPGGRVGYLSDSAVVLEGARLQGGQEASATQPASASGADAAAATGTPVELQPTSTLSPLRPGMLQPVRPVPGAEGPTLEAARMPRIFVRDLGHLVELVGPDAAVSTRAQALVQRQSAGFWVMGGGLAAGAALVTAGLLSSQRRCELDSMFGDAPRCTNIPHVPLLSAGVLLGLAGGATGWLLLPKGGDVAEVVNAWNARHPSESFDLTPGASLQR